MKKLIKNGKVYIDNKFENKDILISNETIAEISDSINSDANTEIIDAAGKYIFPGFIDAHVHLRDPGFTYKEDIVSGTKAAAKGGFTTVCTMPNTDPVCDNIATVEYIKRKAKDLGYCKVQVIGALTKGSRGKEITEISIMKDGGIVGLSDDGNCVQNSKLMLNAFKYVSHYDLPVIVHAEDYDLAGNGQINSGKMATKLGLSGISALSEEVIIDRDIRLAEAAGCKLHIAHISTKKAVDMVRRAKADGIRVTAEVTPHHLVLNEEAVAEFDQNTKVKPPLRREEDRLACIEALKDGTIDFIATDHAPHADYEKEKEFILAPFGINTFETTFSVLYTELVKKGIMDLEILIDRLTAKPAKLFKFEDTGKIEINKKADLTIADLESDIIFTPKNFLSKSHNTPFIDKKFQGRIIQTICNGKTTYKE